MANRKYDIITQGPDKGRIIALIDIPRHDVSVGDIGGFVESYDNLSQDGDCWVDGAARVFENALVSDDAFVFEGARVYGNAHVFETAFVGGDAEVYDNAQVYGGAYVWECDSKVYGNAKVYGNSEVNGPVQVYGDAEVYGDVQLFGDIRIHGNARVSEIDLDFEEGEIVGDPS